ncbi:MAG: MarR family transcriptional regulator [Gammaproteobacteria bacterium]|nr:MarR family transcriptional regulator [Gammaproteobacteria bacterium]
MDKNEPTTGSLVWHLAIRWRTEVDRAVARFGITHAQYSLLASLHALQERGISPTQRELAEYTGLQPIYVSKLVRSAEEAGHVVRKTDRDDSRALRLTLTKPGSALIVQARSVVKALDERLTACLGGPNGAETKRFKRTLRLLLDQSQSKGG